MKGYLFGEKKCMHKFCPDCGSSLFVDPHADDPELIVVNVCVFFSPSSFFFSLVSFLFFFLSFSFLSTFVNFLIFFYVLVGGGLC